MAWQNTFNAVFGPGLFAGITVGDWLRLLRANNYAIHPRYALRCLSITAGSLANSAYGKIEKWRYGSRFIHETIQPPLFVLGHWRSGTTYLHHLLSQDDRFAFPSLYQVLYPNTFLTTEATNTRLFSFLLPRTRFGIDNMKVSWNTPYEDEFAIAATSGLSPYVTMAFPRRQQNYDRFLTLGNASPTEINQWKTALTTFLKKLTWKHGCPLILKSPGHTCRIRLLLDLFPNAKFVHIQRNPFRVFQSMQRMVSVSLRYWKLQNDDSIDWEQRSVRQYREMYDAYFDQRQLIPDGNLHELSFENLEADPVGQLRGVYEAIELPDFEYFEPKLREYLGTLSGYKKNRHVELSAETRDRLVREWGTCFDVWGYPKVSDDTCE